MLGADKQPGTTIGRRAAGIDITQTRDARHGSTFARYVNLQGHRGAAGILADENHAALREAVLLAQAQEFRATNHVAKGPTRGGRRVVIVEGNAQ